MESFWSVVRLLSRREAYGIGYLTRAGFETYLPRLRECRLLRGRRVETRACLFPGYCFCVIRDGQWYEARWCPGTIGLIMDGARPARVADSIIAGLRGRERAGLIELPKAPGLRRGDRVRITAGAFTDHLALYQGQSGRDRVDVLLSFLGGRQRVELAAGAVEVVT